MAVNPAKADPRNDPYGNRIPSVRHTDALTRALNVIAASKAGNNIVRGLIKNLDMQSDLGNDEVIEFGTALEDGSDFIMDISTE